jgi:hypothetical protein
MWQDGCNHIAVQLDPIPHSQSICKPTSQTLHAAQNSPSKRCMQDSEIIIQQKKQLFRARQSAIEKQNTAKMLLGKYVQSDEAQGGCQQESRYHTRENQNASTMQ